jgi:uncharacterized damage-inducible protein DinB
MAAMDTSKVFLEKSRSLLLGEYLPKIERCLEGLTDADVWWRANESSNSVGNLVLHLCGNVPQWMIGGVGGRPYERQRQQEFDERRPIRKAELLQSIRAVLRAADEVLGQVNPEDLTSRRQIQGYDVTVLEVIYHVVEHFSMHTGQIILITKARTGEDLRLWEPPSGR